MWEKGERGCVVQNLVRGLLLPEDVHTFEDGTDESLDRRLQWHTIAVISYPLVLYWLLHTLFFLYLSLFIFCCTHHCLFHQAVQLTHVLNRQPKELAEREKALKEVVEAIAKEKTKAAATTEKKVAASEKARVSAEKKSSELVGCPVSFGGPRGLSFKKPHLILGVDPVYSTWQAFSQALLVNSPLFSYIDVWHANFLPPRFTVGEACDLGLRYTCSDKLAHIRDKSAKCMS